MIDFTTPDILTYTLRDGNNAVTTTYKSRPKFQNQVLGDLIRKHWAAFPDNPIRVPADFTPVANAVRLS